MSFKSLRSLIFIGIAVYGISQLRGQLSSQNSVTDNMPVAKVPVFEWPAQLKAGEVISSPELRTVKNYLVVFDGSGSMNEVKCSGPENKIEVAKRAVKEFSSKIPKDANLGLVVFDANGLTERIPLGINDKNAFENEIDRISINGGTPLKSAITLAAKQLATQAAKQLGYGEYHLVVVTDGEASKSEDPRGIVDSLLSSAPIVIHTVGFCIGAEHSLNQAGRVAYQSADSPEELRSGLADVLAEATTFNVDGFNKK